MSELHAGPGYLTTGHSRIRQAGVQTCYYKGGTVLEWGSILIK